MSTFNWTQNTEDTPCWYTIHRFSISHSSKGRHPYVHTYKVFSYNGENVKRLVENLNRAEETSILEGNDYIHFSYKLKNCIKQTVSIERQSDKNKIFPINSDTPPLFPIFSLEQEFTLDHSQVYRIYKTIQRYNGITRKIFWRVKGLSTITMTELINMLNKGKNVLVQEDSDNLIFSITSEDGFFRSIKLDKPPRVRMNLDSSYMREEGCFYLQTGKSESKGWVIVRYTYKDNSYKYYELSRAYNTEMDKLRISDFLTKLNRSTKVGIQEQGDFYFIQYEYDGVISQDTLYKKEEPKVSSSDGINTNPPYLGEHEGDPIKKIDHVVQRLKDELFKELLNLQKNYIPYQVCPKCGGTGIITATSWTTTNWNTTCTCDVCNGTKIIPQHKVNEDLKK